MFYLKGQDIYWGGTAPSCPCVELALLDSIKEREDDLNWEAELTEVNIA